MLVRMLRRRPTGYRLRCVARVWSAAQGQHGGTELVLPGASKTLLHVRHCTASSCDPYQITRKQLQGTLPENIGELTELVELDVGYNQLQGSIPKSVAELTLLKTLVLYSNQFGNILFMCAHVTPTL